MEEENITIYDFFKFVGVWCAHVHLHVVTQVSIICFYLFVDTNHT